MENARILSGKAHVLGENVDTDMIISGKYVSTTDQNELARHVLECVDPDFASKVSPGDFIVGGKNFGCGSSREMAVDLLAYIGIKVIVAPSFARIFYRNAINLGLLVIECPEIDKAVCDGDVVTYDLDTGIVTDTNNGEEKKGSILPDFLLNIWEQGGAVKALKNKSNKSDLNDTFELQS
ncbi:MAG TPA: 3-isopropylmalate dehydratase [Anaerovoracaceae bacterium]|nr:3-isopropylmalate dehydratase [Anaerovoracaceae bacterium]